MESQILSIALVSKTIHFEPHISTECIISIQIATRIHYTKLTVSIDIPVPVGRTYRFLCLFFRQLLIIFF